MSDSTTPAAPRPAATIALVRDAVGGPEVFFVRRHARSGFMANAFVFPGGRLDPEDAAPGLIERLGPDAASVVALMEGVPDKVTALAHLVAAVRETFEESGILLATRKSGVPVTPLEQWQRALNDGDCSFESLMDEEDLVMATDALAYFSHWITPTFEPRRYDARFFLAVAPADQEGQHDGKETTESLWISPAAALRRHAAGDLFVAPPQWQVLRDLCLHASTAELLSWARDLDRVPPIQPHRFSLDATLALALPGDPEHPDVAETRRDRPTRRIVLRDGTWRDA